MFKNRKEYDIAITGLSRSGKTIFLTSLVDNLMNNQEFRDELEYGYAEEKKGSTFHWKENAKLIKSEGKWPQGTSSISNTTIYLRDEKNKIIKTLNFMDYPGEWIMDFQLLNRSEKMDYEQWSVECTKLYGSQECMQPFYDKLKQCGDFNNVDNVDELAKLYTEGLLNLKKEHFYDLTPGRFIMQDGTEDDGDLSFFPININDKDYKEKKKIIKSKLFQHCKKKFENYKKKYVKPNKKKFQNFDHQIVFIDVLEMLYNGYEVHENIKSSIAKMFKQYKYVGTDLFSFYKSIKKWALVGTKSDLFYGVQKKNYRALLEEVHKVAIKNTGGKYSATMDPFIISSLVATRENQATGETEITNEDGEIVGSPIPIPSEFPSVDKFEEWKNELPIMRTHFFEMPYGSSEALRNENILDLLKFLIQDK